VITCKTELSEKQLLRGMKLHFRTSTYDRWVLPLSGITLIVLMGRRVFLDPGDWQNYAFLSLGFIAITIPLWRVPLLRRNIRRMPNWGKEVDWTLDEKSIHAEGDGFTFTQDWSTIYSVTIAKEGLLVYPQKRLFYWLPLEGFATQTEFATVVRIATSQVKRIKTVQQGVGG